MKKQIIYLMAFILTGLTATAQIDRTQMPKSGPTPEINLGEPETFTLKNGLKVLMVQDKKLPTVNMSLRIDNPPIYEGKIAGVQSLTGSLMGKGTQKTSKDDFNEEVDFLGASVNVRVGGGGASALSKYQERVMELLAEAALMPKFTQEELDFEKKQLLENLKSGENSAAAISARITNSLVYGKKHPAGEFATEETINNVKLSDVETFYRNYFVPSQAYMVISGDIDFKDTKKMVKKLFGDWSPGVAPHIAFPGALDAQFTQVNLIDVPNAVQTELTLKNTTDLKIADEDYFASIIANYILGGGFGSYLNMNLREEHGYTYGARSSIGANKEFKSTFTAAAKVRNEVTDSAIVETLKEIRRIRENDVTDEELANAKAQYLGNFIMSSESKTVIANRAVTIETENLPKDFYKNYIANINAVTKDDIKRVVNKYVKIDNMRIVLVGKAADLIPGLEKLQWNGKPLPIFYYDKEGEKTTKPKDVKLPEGVTAQSVLSNYIKAIGGEAAVKNINTYMFTAEYAAPQGTVALVEKRGKDDKWNMAITMGGMALSQQKFSNGVGYAQGQKTVGDDLTAQKNEAAFMPELYKTSVAKVEGMETIEGKKAVGISFGGKTVNFYDLSTGLKIGREVEGKDQTGQLVKSMLKYSNYKEYSGVKFPTVLTQSMMGQQIDFKIAEVIVNSGVSDSDFTN